jgi:hypothetical protein
MKITLIISSYRQFCEGHLQIPHMKFQKTFRIHWDIRRCNDYEVYVGAIEMN